MFLELKKISKLFDNNNGVREFSVGIEEGEFVTILGPSGCGKTTALNLIGGFLPLDSGEILLEGVDISNLPPERRPLSTVFQSYALFPHMNVLENVAYGIRFHRKKKKKESKEMAKEYIDIVGLSGYEEAMVGNLSGGQQQRVALARSMATNPKILLLDEPLSNLDASLRVKMREELKELQERFNITMIFVTHDQEEALSLSDKIIVMNKGCIEQIGTPREVYFSPANSCVSSFIGKSNIYKEDGKDYVLRPEDISLEKSLDGDYKILEKTFMGSHTEYIVSNNDNKLEVNLSGIENSYFEIDEKVDLIIEYKILLED